MLHIKISQGLTTLAATITLFTLAGCGKQASSNQQSSSNSSTTTSKVSTSSATTSSLTKVQDHKWHSGFPKVLQGTWVTNQVTKGGSTGGTGETTISGDSINTMHRFAPVNPVSASGFQYKYVGGNNYTVKNDEYTLNFRLYNNDKIYFSGTRTGDYGDGAIYHRDGGSDSSTTTKQSSSSPVDNKTAGVLSELFMHPNAFKGGSGIGLKNLYYSEQENSNGNEATKGFSYITANGDPTSYYYFKVDNGNVIVKQLEPGKSVADGHWKVTTISLDRLLKDYYVTDAQKQEVQGYANQLKPESSYKVGGNN